MTEFLLPPGNTIYNIAVWIQCCVGMVGLVFNDDELLENALYGEYGLLQQLEKGTTEDYIWKEGSLHYHYYVLEGLTAICELLRESSPDCMSLFILKDMYLAPLRLSPDGWYPLTLGNYGAQIIQAAYLTKDEIFMEKADRIISEDPEFILQQGVILATDKY